nr:prolipoprotein diacylglyceryl transferase [Desulfobulbaceae bacterium]
MLTFPEIDPVIFSIGPAKVRWYGLMYVLGFICSYYLVLYQIKKNKLTELGKHFENINFMLIVSLIVGGRLGYVFFYNFSYYISHPSEILATWQGGMSFHGAFLGTVLGGIVFCWKNKLNFWSSADVYIVTIPIGLGFGRIGNFINAELFGRVTEVPWGMIFPGGGPLPRHPSQLYEALLEGVVLFGLLWIAKDRKFPSGYMVALFLVFYGVFRSFVELFRQPDVQIGFLFDHITMGQLLSSLMILSGLFIMALRKGKSITQNQRS